MARESVVQGGSPTGHRRRLKSRFQKTGTDGFADYELLELALTFAIPRRDTKPLAKALIRRFKTFKGVLDAASQDVAQVSGAGEQTVLFLSFLRGVMERYLGQRAQAADFFDSPEAVVAYCRASVEGLHNEVFEVLYLSNSNELLGKERLGEGTINQTAVYPRRVIEGALQAHAAGVILVHNHPSGDPSPSEEDRRVTQDIRRAGALVNVGVLDHIIIGQGKHFSFRREGILEWEGDSFSELD